MMTNPFIHGTTSDALVGALRTDLQIMPTLRMLREFHIAPLTGEMIYGYNTLETISSEVDGISFGKCSECLYDLDRVITYAKVVPRTILHSSPHQISQSMTHSRARAFNNLNEVIVEIGRIKQRSDRVRVVPSTELADYLHQLDATIQFYYLVQIVCKFIKPIDDFSKIQERHPECKSSEFIDMGISHTFHKFLNFEEILKKILSQRELDLKAIHDNPTHANVVKALELLDVPTQYEDKRPYSATGEDFNVKLPLSNFFSARIKSRWWQEEKALIYKPTDRFDVNTGTFWAGLSNNKSPHEISDLLEMMVKHDIPQTTLDEIHNNCEQHIRYLQESKTLFESVCSNPCPSPITDPLLDEPCPVVLVTNSSTIKSYGSEYRSFESMKLGRDITLLATDTVENQFKLQAFFTRHNIFPMQVVLLEDLRKAHLKGDDLPTIHTHNMIMFVHKMRFPKVKDIIRILYELNNARIRLGDSDQIQYAVLNRFFDEFDTHLGRYVDETAEITPEKTKEFIDNISDMIGRYKNDIKKNEGWLVQLFLFIRGLLYPNYQPKAGQYGFFSKQADSLSHSIVTLETGTRLRSPLVLGTNII